MRCDWVPLDSTIYADYHDHEWGRPAVTPIEIFEKISLEGFQSGLSWITVLRKRERFREVFEGFDFEKVSTYGPKEIELLLTDQGIIRHRGKIEAVINNAQKAIELESTDGLVKWFWSFADKFSADYRQLKMKDVPVTTERSVEMAKALKKKGWKFVGPTTVYAFMQSEGLVNDHVQGCNWFEVCEDLRKDVFKSL